MKHLIIISLLIFSSTCTFAQVVIPDLVFENYIDHDSLSWQKKAQELSLEYSLNDEGELKLTEIREFKGQTKSELYHKVLEWIKSFSTEVDSSVQIANEEEGQIITNCCLNQIFRSNGFSKRIYHTSIKPMLQFDFKDGKVRFIYTLNSFDVLELKQSAENILCIGSQSEGQAIESMIDRQTLRFENSYPFNKESNTRLKTLGNRKRSNSSGLNSATSVSSHLYVNSIALYHILKDKMVNALTKPKAVMKNDNTSDW